MIKTKGVGFSFERWILKFKKESSPKGVIGRLVYSSTSFPRIYSKDTIKKYLKNNGASNDVLQIIDVVYAEFEEIYNAKFQNDRLSPPQIGAF